MSAYSGEKGGQVLPFNGGSHVSDTTENQSDLPSALPKFSNELGNFILVARQIETALHQEKSLSKKLREELQAIQQKNGQIVAELQSKMRELTTREESMSAQWMAREEGLKSIISCQEQSVKTYNEQIKSLSLQIEVLREEKKKIQVELEYYKNTMRDFKEQERSLKSSLQVIQASEKSRLDIAEKLTHENQALRRQLRQYQFAWHQVQELDRKAKNDLMENGDAKRKLEELRESLSIETRRRENLEELVKKEKRDKQIALNCLHAAEERLLKHEERALLQQHSNSTRVDHEISSKVSEPKREKNLPDTDWIELKF